MQKEFDGSVRKMV